MRGSGSSSEVCGARRGISKNSWRPEPDHPISDCVHAIGTLLPSDRHLLRAMSPENPAVSAFGSVPRWVHPPPIGR